MKQASIVPTQILFASRKWLFPTVALWALLVFGIFFYSLYQGSGSFFRVLSSLHREPANAEFTQRLHVWKESLVALMTGFLIFGILWSCGRRLFLWLSVELTGTLRFCLEIGLGIFLFNLFWLGFGLVGLWYDLLWLVGFVLLGFLFLKDLLEIQRKGFSFTLPGNVNLWFFGICAFYLLFLLLHSILPETFYDSLNYFLGMPSFWLWHHGICDYPTHLLSGYFHGGSLFFMSGFVLAGTEGAKVLGALTLCLIALFCGSWISQLVNPVAGTAAATAVLTFPLLYLNSWAIRVDGILCFFLLLFLYVLQRATSGGKVEGRWIVLAGLLAGIALTIKPTAITVLAAGLLALVWLHGLKILGKKEWIYFGGAIAFEAGPWLLKNYAFAGNPFFPYANRWMGGRPVWPAGYQRLLHENQQFLPMDHGFLSILNLPWRLTMPDAGDGQFIGPLLLAFLPLLFLFRFQDAAPKFLARVLFLSLTLGLCLSHMLRFSIPSFLAAFLILSAGVATHPNKSWNYLWTGMVTLSALLCLGEYFLLSKYWYDGWGIWSGGETREEYLSRRLPSSYSAVPWIKRNIPKDSRLLAVGDAQVLYYPVQAYANSVFDEPFFAVAARREGDAAGILKRLKELGITHVVFDELLGVINSEEYHQYNLNREEWNKLYDFVRRGLEPLLIRREVGLYRVKDALDEEGRVVPNPFDRYPSQAGEFLRALSDKNYSKANQILGQLESFFPGDPQWDREENELRQLSKPR
ncbi:MAG TPA: glycosyltransferase family 39 protein [bacterium]|nr:glycosyltransferase family 39 protein [bacterium]